MAIEIGPRGEIITSRSTEQEARREFQKILDEQLKRSNLISDMPTRWPKQ